MAHPYQNKIEGRTMAQARYGTPQKKAMGGPTVMPMQAAAPAMPAQALAHAQGRPMMKSGGKAKGK